MVVASLQWMGAAFLLAVDVGHVAHRLVGRVPRVWMVVSTVVLLLAHRVG